MGNSNGTISWEKTNIYRGLYDSQDVYCILDILEEFLHNGYEILDNDCSKYETVKMKALYEWFYAQIQIIISDINIIANTMRVGELKFLHGFGKELYSEAVSVDYFVRSFEDRDKLAFFVGCKEFAERTAVYESDLGKNPAVAGFRKLMGEMYMVTKSRTKE